MANETNDKPKIIVDDDWKKQAQEEKRRLGEKVAKQAPEAAEGDEGDEGAAGGPQELPPADLSTLISALATQTMMSLGGYQDPKTKQRYVDLDVAKHYIDTLTMLEQKTKGNLSDEETALLNNVVYQLRMNYVQVTQAVASGPISPTPPGRIQQ